MHMATGSGGKMPARSLMLVTLAVIKKISEQKAGEVWETRLHTVGGNVEHFSTGGSHQELAQHQAVLLLNTSSKEMKRMLKRALPSVVTARSSTIAKMGDGQASWSVNMCVSGLQCGQEQNTFHGGA